MLIWLDDSIEQTLPSLTDNGLLGLDGIIQAMARGEHLVLGNRKVFQGIAAQKSLSALNRRLANAQAGRLTQLGAIHSIFTHNVTVVNDNGPTLTQQGNSWRIQIDELGKHGLRPIVLLGEDISDTQLLLEAATHYSISKRINRVLKPHADNRGAGGKANLARSLHDILKRQHTWCFCITDSDRLSTQCAPALLTNRINKLVSIYSGSTVCGHYVLPTRELENILPIHLISDALESQQDASASNAWLSYINDYKISPTIHKYVDLKEGTSLFSIKNIGVAGSIPNEWKEEIDRIIPITGIKTDCFKGKCEKHKNKDNRCRCLITPAISQKLSEIVIDYLEKQSKQKIVERISSSDNADLWMALGKEVFDWTCGTLAPLT